VTDCSRLNTENSREICESTVQHGHYEITMQAPVGMGTNHEILIDVGGRLSNTDLTYDFDPPFLEQATPGSVSKGNGYLDALGTVNGAPLTFSGDNFGGVRSNTSVKIDGETCPSAEWHAADNNGFPYVSCEPNEMTVGPKNISLTVALQTIESTALTGSRLATRSLVSTICKSRANQTSGLVTVYYGQNGEYCAPCPEGGVCQAETTHDPYARPEWWLTWLNISNDVDLARADGSAPGLQGRRCHPKRWDRETYGNAIVQERCPDIVPCSPKESCLGNNTCAVGYQWIVSQCRAARNLTAPNFCETDRDCDPNPRRECTLSNPEHCSACVKSEINGSLVGRCECRAATRCTLCTALTHYKMDGVCERCPDNPGLLLALIIAGGVFAMIGGYVLGQRNFNMAFLSIGIDYLQVLALFAGSNIRWPSWMSRLFQILSIFNFNVDVTAPECLIPELPFFTKWMAMMGLPIFCAAALIIVWLVKLLWKLCCLGKRRWKDLNTHAARTLATFTLLYYYMYLSLTRNALRIFNCNPILPDDGYLYTDFTDLTCEGGLCRCDHEGGLQMILKTPAALAIVIYSLGYPAFILFILRRYKARIKEDQLLRAAGLGDEFKTSTSRETYSVRKKWHKLYYHFKPGKTYWTFYIVCRKLFIATAGLMFRGSPSFQLAFVLMVLFAAYVLQVRNRPYMSTAERAQCLDFHREKARQGDPFHRTMAPIMENAIREQKRRIAKQARRDKNHRLNKLMNQTKVTQRILKTTGGKEYFWNYNTIEATLLACAVFVCLAGIMFESSQFDDRPDLIWMQDMIAVVVAIVLIFSFVYYLAVFSSEVLGKTPKCVLRCCASEKKNEFNDKEDEAVRRGSIQMANINVLSVTGRDSERAAQAEAEAAQLRAQLEIQGLAMNKLAKSAKDQKHFVNPLMSKKGRGRVQKKKKKKAPGQLRKTSAALVPADEIEIAGLVAKAQKTEDVAPLGKGKVSAPSLTSMDLGTPPIASKKRSFKRHVSGSGREYFADINTNETVWELPEGAVVL
jgi:hypothetical protein